jgi:repressor LexA
MKIATFAERLAEAMRFREVSQTELHNRTGINKSSISTYLKGEYEAKQKKVYEIARALSVSPAWLMGYDVSINGDNKDDTETETPPRRKGVKIPIYGSIVAGIPETAEQDILGWFEIPEELAERGDYYMLKVHGMSMSPDICDGDYVLVRQQETAHSGDICVINVNGDECTLKEIQITPEGVLLVGYNQAEYKPKFYTNEEVERLPLRIQGVVIQCIRKYKEY